MKWSPSQKPLPTGGLHGYRGSWVETADPALMPTSMPCPTGSRPSVALLTAKDHVNVFLYDARALTAMFKNIIANSRAGGWRKLKRES